MTTDREAQLPLTAFASSSSESKFLNGSVVIKTETARWQMFAA